MKTKVKVFIVIVAIFLISIINKRGGVEFTDLVFNNIEALANTEGEGEFFCFGTGSIDCYGDKVEIKYTGLR